MSRNKDGGMTLPSSIKNFLAELEDLLEKLNRDLLDLEDNLSSGKETHYIINNLFRNCHTMKGLAGMLSLKEIGALAHALEDLLDAVRLGKIDLGQEVLEILTRGYEHLGRNAKVISIGGKASAHKAFLRKIEEFTAASIKETSPDDLLSKLDLDDEIIRTLTEYEEHRLIENLNNKRNLYIISKEFTFEHFDDELNGYLSRLKSDGEVISTLPSPSAEDHSKIRFDLLWATSSGHKKVAESFLGEEAEITAVQQKSPQEKDKSSFSSSLRSFSDTVRVDIKRLDNLLNIVGELVIYKTKLGEISREIITRHGMDKTSLGLNKTVKALERNLDLLQRGVIETRMVPIGQMFGKLHRIVRQLSRRLGKKIDFTVSGEETELDKLVIEEMADPLLHLIRNAIDHGIETPQKRRKAKKPSRGTIGLSAFQKGHHIVIEIEDDGAGIDINRVRKIAEQKGLLGKGMDHEDKQVLSMLFLPGFSTSSTISDISGRGIGMDVVKNNVSRLRGMIDIETEPGRGTRTSITLPMTLAIIQALMVKVSDSMFAVPINSVLESLKITSGQVQKVEDKEVIKLRDRVLPLLRIDDFFNLESSQNGSPGKDDLYIVVVGLAEKRLGLVVDSLRGQREIVIKSLGNLLKSVKGIAGATDLGDRRAILVLDVNGLIQEVTHSI